MKKKIFQEISLENFDYSENKEEYDILDITFDTHLTMSIENDLSIYETAMEAINDLHNSIIKDDDVLNSDSFFKDDYYKSNIDYILAADRLGFEISNETFSLEENLPSVDIKNKIIEQKEAKVKLIDKAIDAARKLFIKIKTAIFKIAIKLNKMFKFYGTRIETLPIVIRNKLGIDVFNAIKRSSVLKGLWYNNIFTNSQVITDRINFLLDTSRLVTTVSILKVIVDEKEIKNVAAHQFKSKPLVDTIIKLRFKELENKIGKENFQYQLLRTDSFTLSILTKEIQEAGSIKYAVKKVTGPADVDVLDIKFIIKDSEYNIIRKKVVDFYKRMPEVEKAAFDLINKEEKIFGEVSKEYRREPNDEVNKKLYNTQLSLYHTTPRAVYEIVMGMHGAIKTGIRFCEIFGEPVAKKQ